MEGRVMGEFDAAKVISVEWNALKRSEVGFTKESLKPDGFSSSFHESAVFAFCGGQGN